jgi:nucleoside 2-deoxyribosyltransferase
MKIYFSGSIYGGREKLDDYKKLIKELSKFGEVLNPEVADDTILEDEKKVSDERTFENLEKEMNEADFIFGEFTIPSLGVGYEIGYADSHEKKIIGIYDKTITPKITTMFRGNKRLKIIPYKDINEIIDNLGNIIKQNLKEE